MGCNAPEFRKVYIFQGKKGSYVPVRVHAREMAEDSEAKKIDSAFENLGAGGLRLQDPGMGDDLYFARFDMGLGERCVDFFDNIDAHPSPQELGAPPRPAEIVDPAVYEKSLRSCCHRKRWAAMPQN